jgi:hypothetical protein
MSDSVHIAAQWLAVVLIAFAAIAAFGALAARSAFAMIMYLAVSAALAATALAAMSAGEAGLVVALVGVAIAPFLLMSAVLLSARASKRGAFPLVSAVLGAAALAPIGWTLADLRAPAGLASQGVAISGLWLALIVFVAAAACAGLLGFGERGIMQRRAESEAP